MTRAAIPDIDERLDEDVGEDADKLMLDVHHKGRAVVSSGTREKAEMDVFRLHEHGLWATMQQDD
jgi:ATP-dependent Clp protease adaptor protein ClpS